MKKLEATKHQELLKKLIRGGRTNLSKWFEKIVDEFCQEQAVEERVLVESIEKYSMLTLLSNFFVFY